VQGLRRSGYVSLPDNGEIVFHDADIHSRGLLFLFPCQYSIVLCQI
jgi:hypothetical protein